MNSNVHPIFRDILAPFAPQPSQHKYSETFIEDLAADVKRAEASAPAGYTEKGSYEEGERLMDELRYRVMANPVQFLAEVKSWLSSPNASDRYPGSRATDSGDEDAWWKVEEVQACVRSGKTDVCVRCKRMEGSHGNVLASCPVQPEFGEQRLSQSFTREVSTFSQE